MKFGGYKGFQSNPFERGREEKSSLVRGMSMAAFAAIFGFGQALKRDHGGNIRVAILDMMDSIGMPKESKKLINDAFGHKSDINNVFNINGYTFDDIFKKTDQHGDILTSRARSNIISQIQSMEKGIENYDIKHQEVFDRLIGRMKSYINKASSKRDAMNAMDYSSNMETHIFESVRTRQHAHGVRKNIKIVEDLKVSIIGNVHEGKARDLLGTARMQALEKMSKVSTKEIATETFNPENIEALSHDELIKYRSSLQEINRKESILNRELDHISRKVFHPYNTNQLRHAVQQGNLDHMSGTYGKIVTDVHNLTVRYASGFDSTIPAEQPTLKNPIELNMDSEGLHTITKMSDSQITTKLQDGMRGVQQKNNFMSRLNKMKQERGPLDVFKAMWKLDPAVKDVLEPEWAPRETMSKFIQGINSWFNEAEAEVLHTSFSLEGYDAGGRVYAKVKFRSKHSRRIGTQELTIPLTLPRYDYYRVTSTGGLKIHNFEKFSRGIETEQMMVYGKRIPAIVRELFNGIVKHEYDSEQVDTLLKSANQKVLDKHSLLLGKGQDASNSLLTDILLASRVGIKESTFLSGRAKDVKKAINEMRKMRKYTHDARANIFTSLDFEYDSFKKGGPEELMEVSYSVKQRDPVTGKVKIIESVFLERDASMRDKWNREGLFMKQWKATGVNKSRDKVMAQLRSNGLIKTAKSEAEMLKIIAGLDTRLRGIQGPIFGANLETADIRILKEVIARHGNKEWGRKLINSRFIGIDTDVFQFLQQDHLLGNRTGEVVEEGIDSMLSYIKKYHGDEYDAAKHYVNDSYRSGLHMSRNNFLKMLKDMDVRTAAHISKYDEVSADSLAYLTSHYGWDTKLNQPGYIFNVHKQIDPYLDPIAKHFSYMDSTGAIGKDSRNIFNPDNAILFYSSRIKQRGHAQAFQGERIMDPRQLTNYINKFDELKRAQGTFSKGKRSIAPGPQGAVAGAEPWWNAFQNYFRVLNTLDVAIPETYDSSAMISTSAYDTGAKVRDVYRVKIDAKNSFGFKVGHRIESSDISGLPTTVSAEDPYDVLGGKYHGNRGGYIVDIEPDHNGKPRNLVVSMDPSKVTSTTFSIDGNKYLVNRVLRPRDLPFNTQWIYNSQRYERSDYGAIVSSLLGRLSLWAGDNQGKKDTLRAVIKARMGNTMNVSEWHDGSLSLIPSIDTSKVGLNNAALTTESSDILTAGWSKEKGFLRNISQVFHDLKLPQSTYNKFPHEKRSFRNALIKPYTQTGAHGVYKLEESRMLIRHLYALANKSEGAKATFYEMYRGAAGGDMSYNFFINSVIGGTEKFKDPSSGKMMKSWAMLLDSRDHKSINRHLQRMPDEWNVAEYLDKASKRRYGNKLEAEKYMTNKLLYSRSKAMSFVQSSRPLHGMLRNPRLHPLVLDALKGQKGSEPIYNILKGMIEKNTYKELGTLVFMAGQGYTDAGLPEWVMDYKKLIESKKHLYSEEGLESLMQKAWNFKKSDLSETLAKRVDELNVYNYEGRIYHGGEANLPLQLTKNLDAYKVKGQYLRGGLKPLGYGDYLRGLAGITDIGKLSLPTEGVPEEFQYVNIPGTKKRLPIKEVFFTDIGAGVRSITIGDQQLDLLDKKSGYFDEAMHHLYSKDYKKYNQVIQQYLNFSLDQIFGDSQKPQLRRGMNGLIQKGITLDESTIKRIRLGDEAFSNDMVMPFDVVFSKARLTDPKYGAKGRTMVKEAIKDMPLADIEYIIKLVRNPSNIEGIAESGVTDLSSTVHVALQGRLDKWSNINAQGESVTGGLTGRQYLDTMHQMSMSGTDRAKLNKLYEQGVMKSLLPLPNVGFRNPTYNPFTVLPTLAWFRDLSSTKYARTKGADIFKNKALNLGIEDTLVSPLINMMIGGDFDGDTFSALFYDESFKDFMLGRVQEMRKMASGKSHLPIIEKEGDFDLFYNFKTHGYTIPRDAKTVIDKLRKESASEKSFSGGILSDVINRLHSEEFWKQAEDNSVLAKQTIKKSAGLTGHMLSNVGRFVDQLGVTLEKQSEFRQVLNRLLEYNVKQKRLLASEQHPMLILIEGMLNPTPENPVYKTIDDIAKYQADPGAMTDLPIDKETGSRFIRLPEIPNARDVQLGTLSGLRYPHEGAKDLYGKIMNQPIDPSLQEWARTIFDNEKGIALLGLKNRSELQGRQITLWEFFKAMELEKKGRLKYGVESMIGKNATGLDILLRAMKDKPVGGYGMEFTSLIADMGDYYSTESLSQSIAKSWRKNAHPKAQKFIKKAMTVPNFFGVKGAMIGVAGYMLYNLFQPDQMNSGLVKVGRMPGTGGEKWDYTFARDERAYDPLMQTPLGNPYDLPKAYLNLLDPNYQKSMRRGIEKRRNYTISHRTTGFGGRQLTRNSYSSPSIPR